MAIASDPATPDLAADPAIPRRRLKEELRKARANSHMTREKAANELVWSLSKLIRIETGDQGMSVTDLRAMLRLYGVRDTDKVKELEKLARSSRGQTWWARYRDLVSRQYGQLLGYEGSASYTWTLHPLLVPGLLHTREYALELRGAHMSKDKAERLVELLAERQKRLFGQQDPPRMTYLFGEEALNRWIGGPAVMRDQLGHLLQVAEEPFATIQVVPFRAGAHPGLIGSFILLGLQGSGEEEDLLFLEGAGGDYANKDDEKMIASFAGYFEKVRDKALSPDETETLIKQKIDQLGRVGGEGPDRSAIEDRQSPGV
jgi:transcriptional regulator with XRE-family HTH domain